MSDQEQSRLHKAWMLLVDVRTLLTVIVITMFIAILVPIRNNRITNEHLKSQLAQLQDIAVINRENNARVRDCVLPTGTCYKEGAARTAAALKLLQNYTDAANICAVFVEKRPEDTVDDVAKRYGDCVKSELKKIGG